MSYTINHYNGTLLTTVADGTVDTSTDLTLIGKNYAGYGQAQNDNFVWLLENFANTSSPPNPLAGQIWYDSGTKKLKFWDGSQFRTTGGAELGSTAPTGLTQGDFWFNTQSNQLYAWTGSTFTLIGPQEVTGAGTTQMQSVSVLDTSNVSHAVIKGIVNDQTVFVIAGSDAPFQLNSTTNPITGFDWIQEGLTLKYTLQANNGVTSGSQRFWGTATNADKLNGHTISDFVLNTGTPQFSSLVNFADVGFTVGSPIAKLAIFNNNQTTPTIQNINGPQIVFETLVSGSTKNPMTINGNDVTPGQSGVSNLGTSLLQWANVYASYHWGTAQQADALNVNNVYVTASTSAVAGTIAARDSSANIYANVFNGTATAAQYADLAEKYLPDPAHEYVPGTVMKVGGPAEICAAGLGDKAIGVISANPAYMMNKDLKGGVYVALKGRVPVKVIGGCTKGDQMAPYGDGLAASIPGFFNGDTANNTCFAVALEDCDATDITLVECVIL
jgi:hypothetical protein